MRRRMKKILQASSKRVSATSEGPHAIEPQLTALPRSRQSARGDTNGPSAIADISLLDRPQRLNLDYSTVSTSMRLRFSARTFFREPSKMVGINAARYADSTTKMTTFATKTIARPGTLSQVGNINSFMATMIRMTERVPSGNRFLSTNGTQKIRNISL